MDKNLQDADRLLKQLADLKANLSTYLINAYISDIREVAKERAVSKICNPGIENKYSIPDRQINGKPFTKY